MATSTNTAIFTQTETFSVVWTFPSQTATARSTSVYTFPYSGTEGPYTVRQTITNIFATPSTAAYVAVRTIVDDSPDLVLTASTPVPTSSAPPLTTPTTFLSTSAPITTRTSTATSLASTPTHTPSPSPGLSKSAKLGIGLGVSFGVLALLALLVAIWWFLFKRPKEQKHMSSQPEQKLPNGYDPGIPCRIE